MAEYNRVRFDAENVHAFFSNCGLDKGTTIDGKLYYFSPYYMIWNNDMYYVVGCGRHGTVMKYRVDRMTNLEVMDEDRKPMPDGYEVSDFFEKEFSMMAGETCTVELLCKNALMGSIIDKFGEDVQTEVYDPEHFKVTVDVKLSELFFGWVFASGGAMKIIGPEQARSAMEDMAKRYLTAEV